MKPAAKPTPRAKETRHPTAWRARALFLVGLFGLFAILGTCSPRKSTLAEVRAQGVLRVATVNSPTAYYIGQGGEPTGFEYDLAKAFADQLGVKLELVLADSPQAAVEMVRSGVAHMAAASITETASRKAQVRFSRPLLKVVPELVYRLGQPRPKNLGDLRGVLRVVKDSAPIDALHALQISRYRQLTWTETGEDVAEELLYQVSQGTLDYTIVNSDLLAINQRYYPNLRTAFTVADALNVAWAFRLDKDTSLSDAAGHFFDALGDKELARIKDRYFGHVNQVDALGALTLATQVDTRLKRYRAAFEQAGVKNDLDWRLLAAIGYQESHWDAGAISPTGVRGIMMLTNDTADFLNVANREDPAQSIEGGSRYFKQIADQLPTEIPEPDRTWMALAAYNMGVGHLLDARILTEQLGRDPNRWIDVRRTLPLLSQSRWYSKTRHGYARGHQAITYVGNIRSYYDMLVWITRDKNAEPKTALEAAEEKKKASDEAEEKADDASPLNIDSPVL